MSQLSFGFGNTRLSSAFSLNSSPTQHAPSAEQNERPAPLPDALAHATDKSVTKPDTSRPNFRLNGDRPLAPSWRGRALDNVAAIRLAQHLETTGRAPTEEEQRALIRFIGFGATDLATTCFRQPGEEAFRTGWEDIARDLEAAVSVAEYAALARATQL